MPAAVFAPDALDAAISLTHVQSAVSPAALDNGTLTVTFSIHNNLPPTLRPDIPVGASITDTIAALSPHDVRRDPNLARNVFLSSTLSSAASFVSASGNVSVSGNLVMWSLGDAPPMGVVTAAVVLRVTPGAGDATLLDSGAAAQATLQGRRVSANTFAARIGSAALAPFLARTPDADSTDPYVLRALARLGPAPAAAFAHVRAIGFETYPGSLRGARGTLWSGSGNALDKASTLIALLRAAGVPARYRHGTLSAANAQTLIASMFKPQNNLLGFLPAGAALADPVNDPGLSAEVSDHWWVEANIDGTWTNLDPSFAAATVGATFHASVAGDGSDRVAEVPDSQRHKIALTLKVERYSNWAFGFSMIQPLSKTFNAVELAGKPVALAHAVNSLQQNGLVFATSTIDYVPYFIIGDDPATADIVSGQPYLDLASSFLSVAQFHTAAWLKFELTQPSGQVQTHEREIVDRIGLAARANGGSMSFSAGNNNQPLVQTAEVFSSWFWGGRVPFEALQRAQAAGLNNIPRFVGDLSAINTLSPLATRTPEQEDRLNRALGGLQLDVASRLAVVGASFAVRADDALDYYAETAHVRAYYAQPRVVSVGAHAMISPTLHDQAYTIDLRSTRARAIVAPGQSPDASFAFQQVKGYMESQLEQEVLEVATGIPALSAARVLSQALVLDVPLVRIDDTQLDQLALLPLSDLARARIREAALAGKEVIVPAQGISITGKLRYAWFETDALTGETVGVMENGLHTAAIEYAGMLNAGLRTLTAGALGFMVGLWSALTPVLVDKLGGDAAAARAQMKLAAKAADAHAKAFCTGSNKTATKVCNFAYKGGKKAGASMVQATDPPLPALLYGIPADALPTHAPVRAVARHTAAANLPAGAIAGGTSVGLLAAFGGGDASTYAGPEGGLAVGGAFAPLRNTAANATLNLSAAGLNIDDAGSGVTLGGQPLAATRFAIENFTGALSIADAGAQDTLTLNGSGTVFALGSSPASSGIAPTGRATVNVLLSSTAPAAYTLVVEGPDGWQVNIDAAGRITATPPAGAAAGAYALSLIAQSVAQPRLMVSARHTVTVTSFEGVAIDVAADPLTTVPIGSVQSDNDANDTNDGRMQLAGAAYIVTVSNTGNITRSFAVSVTGLTAQWLLFAGAPGSSAKQITLAPGARAQLGLAISPTLPLPGVGSSFPFNVNARGVDNPALSASAADVFVIASTPYPFLQLVPPVLYAAPGTSVTFGLQMTNVGNAAGTFPLSFEPPPGSAWTAALAPVVNLAPGLRASQRVTISNLSGAVGDARVIGIATSAGAYSPTAYALVLLTTPAAGCAWQFASQLQDPALATPAGGLAGAVQALEAALPDLPARDRVITAIDTLVVALARLPGLPAVAALSQLGQDMRSHSTAPQLQADLDALCAALKALGPQIDVAQAHAFALAWSPASQVALAGRAVTLTLSVQNQGTLSGSHSVTLTSPAFATQVFSPELAAGASTTITLVMTRSSAGFVPVYATGARATGSALVPMIERSAIAGVSYVTPALAVMSVVASPNFVDVGTSATQVQAVLANTANWQMNTLATLSVFAPTGALSETRQTAVTMQPGLGATANFGMLNTSGFASGVYTLAVSVAVSSPLGLAGGAPATNYGFLGVGQALFAEAAVLPALVAPGTVTVTQIITTRVRAIESPVSSVSFAIADVTERPAGAMKVLPALARLAPEAPLAYDAGSGFTRTNAADAGVLVSGTWSSSTSEMAHRGSYSRSNVVGSVLTFTVTGSWVSLGYLAGDDGRHFEVLLDGVSQGVIDSYANGQHQPRSRVFSGLANTAHTLEVRVLAGKNAFASATSYAKIDFVDASDGSLPADGSFEHTDPRVLLGSGWTTETLAAASGGSYGRSGFGTGSGVAWFAFGGDTLSLKLLKDFNANAGMASLYVDGLHKADIDLESVFENAAVSTATLSFNNLGAGVHVATWVARRASYISQDAFVTPGVAPWVAPNIQTGIARHEETASNILFEGAPLTGTSTVWDEAFVTQASDGYVARTSATGATMTATFSGTWAILGYYAENRSGRVEIFVDGLSRGVLDTYSPGVRNGQYVLAGLAPGPHILTATLQVTRNAFASFPGYFHFDYLDVWDGTPLTAGTFNEDDARVRMSDAWNRNPAAAAEGGFYAQSGLGSGVAWFPFSGSSATYQVLNGFNNAGVANVYVDGTLLARIDQTRPMTGTSDFSQTYSFTGLANGPHVMQVEYERGSYISVDAFTAPATGPGHSAPATNGIRRFEEWAPELRYNGVPLTATSGSWDGVAVAAASDGYVRGSPIASDTLSLAFTGTWASLGYIAQSNTGIFEVFIDGVSRGRVDSYGSTQQPRSIVFANLPAGPHVISFTVTGTRNPLASPQGAVYFDYIDVWDGTPLGNRVLEENDARIWTSGNWQRNTHAQASGGGYAQNPLASGGLWVPFEGDSLAIDFMAGIANAAEATVWVDGIFKGHFELYDSQVTTRSIALNGLGAGPHVATIAPHRGFYIGVDRLRAPADGPYVSFARSGIFRLEEDDPALRYNGVPFTQTRTSWGYGADATSSNVYLVRSDSVSDTLSLTFTGRYVGLGLIAATNGRQAEIFIDGASQGTVDTYGVNGAPITRIFIDLISGTHVISLAVLATVNPSATGGLKYLHVDFIDVWDGTPEPQDLYQVGSAQIALSNNWTATSNPNATDGRYHEDGTSAWFLFTGMTVTVLAMTERITPAMVEIFVDDVSMAVVDLYSDYGRKPIPVTIGGLSDGGHVLRLRDASGGTRRAGFDAFDTRAVPFAGLPAVEWSFSAVISPGQESFATSPAVGDINGDGLPDVIATTSHESCVFVVCSYLDRAVYALNGDGSGLIFSRTFTGTSNLVFGVINGGTGSPALVNLDGGTGIEVLVPAGNGLHALKNDGSTLWWNRQVRNNWASAPAVANLDADDAPEIVSVDFNPPTNLMRVVVLQPDGAISWIYTFTNIAPEPRLPVLADMNGDGALDILIASGQTLYLFHNLSGTFGLAHTPTLGLEHYGAPAVADLDGDGSPEVVIGWTGVIQALNATLNSRWVYTTGGINPSTVSVANLDADPSPELVLFSKTSGPNAEVGRVFALNHDGSLLWSQPAKDTTSSSAGVAVLDFDGDGQWEVIWNGYVSGTLIFKGDTGAILFQELEINSGTVNETPVIADVDNDGHAEVLLVDGERLVALGFDAGWSASRPIWNQHSYHISNIADDLSVPPREPASWVLHNTYRTQTPLTQALPVYSVDVSHTVAAAVQVLTPTFSAPHSATPPTYAWSYKHYSTDALRSVRFDSVLPNVQPGELRQVSTGTRISYSLQAGQNLLHLPPMFVQGAHILFASPPSQTAGAGTSASFAVRLDNPAGAAAVYTLAVAGLPAGVLAGLPPTLSVPARGSVTTTLWITLPASTTPANFDVLVQASTPTGGSEVQPVSVVVVSAPAVSLAPDAQTIDLAARAVYTARITNTVALTRSFALSVSADGMGSQFPASITLGPLASAQIPLTLTAIAAGVFAPRLHVADVAAGTSSSAGALLTVGGARSVMAMFGPATVSGGLSNDILTVLAFTNTGTLSDTFDVSLHAPAGWTIMSVRSAAATDAQALSPYIGHSVRLQVRLNANGASPAGTYPISASVQSRALAGVRAVTAGQVQLQAAGVRASLTPSPQSAAPGAATGWSLHITNTAATAATYAITGAGTLAANMQFASTSVTLNGGASATVNLNLSVPARALPGAHDVVARVTQVNAPVAQTDAVGLLNITEAPASHSSITRASVVISEAARVAYLLTITNTGNIVERYQLTPASLWPVTLDQRFVVLAPGFSTSILLSADAAAPGAAPIVVTAADRSSTSASAMLTYLDATPTYGVLLTAAPRQRDTRNAQPVDFSVIVTNTGSALQTFDLSVNGSGPVTLSQSSVSLAPGAQAALSLTLAAPAVRGYTATVTATGTGASASDSVALRRIGQVTLPAVMKP